MSATCCNLQWTDEGYAAHLKTGVHAEIENLKVKEGILLRQINSQERLIEFLRKKKDKEKLAFAIFKLLASDSSTGGTYTDDARHAFTAAEDFLEVADAKRAELDTTQGTSK